MDAWFNRRKVVSSMLGALALVVTAMVAMYVAGVLFLVKNRIDPAQAGITSVIDYWRMTADESERREQLLAAILASACVCLAMLVYAAPAASLLCSQLFARRFGSAAEIRRAGLLNCGDQPRLLVGKYRGRQLGLPGTHSVMLFAPSGSGKGVVIPSVLNWLGSVVVLDIDGRSFEVTAGSRASHQPVFAFSPFDGGERSHCWNPLSAVRRCEEHRKADLLGIAEVIFPVAGEEQSDAFFNERARLLFLGLGLMLLESPELPCTIGEMLRQVSGLQVPVLTHLVSVILRRRDQGRPYSGECLTVFSEVLSWPSNTVTLVAGTFRQALSIFGETSVDVAMSGDDFRLEDVRRRPMSIYLRIPASRLGGAQPLLNLFISQWVMLNTRQTPAQDPNLAYRCLLVNDEFAAVGRVDAIASSAGVLGDFNLRLLTVIGEMSQLDAVYGWQAARRLVADHGARILYGPHRKAHPEYDLLLAHDNLAMVTAFWTRLARLARAPSGYLRSLFLGGEGGSNWPSPRLRASDEPGKGRLVLITPNCMPVMAHKIDCDSDEAVQPLLRPPPVVPCLDMRRHRSRVQRRVPFVPRPVEKASPPASDPDTALVRDLGGLTRRFEQSREISRDTPMSRRREVDADERQP